MISNLIENSITDTITGTGHLVYGNNKMIFDVKHRIIGNYNIIGDGNRNIIEDNTIKNKIIIYS